jgi:prolyl oligopeptidase
VNYPTARRQDIVDSLHWVDVADPYRWLEDPSSAETQAWLAAQDALARPYLDALPARPHFRKRLEELLQVGSITAPSWRGERCFYQRREPGQEMAVLLVREPDGAERVLLDPLAIDPTGTTTLDLWAPSQEGDLLAYQLSTGGDEEARVRVLDVKTGEIVDGPIDRCRYSPIAWLPGGKEFFYVRRLAPDRVPAGETMYHRRVYRHRLGGDAERDDVEIFGEGLAKTNYYGADVSWGDGRWLIVSARQGTSPHGDTYIADLHGDGELRPLALQEMTYAEVGHDGRLYLFTKEGSPRGRVDVADPARPGDRRTLIPETDAVLQGAGVVDGAVVCSWQRDCFSRIDVRDPDTGAPLGEVPLPGMGTAGAALRPDGGRRVWVPYTDFANPGTVYEYDLDSGELSVWATAPGAEHAEGVPARQVFFESRDGTRIPMFVLGDAEADGVRPAILTGYGGFNNPMAPAYNVVARAWVEAGGIYAIANLRGGSEYGEEWHRAGMRERKQNVFDDFIAAGEWLIAEGLTDRERLGISGGSNGGLLVGAALTQCPELWRCVVCSAPLLDMVRYELFGLGATWNHEYGRAEDPVEFGWLYGYSPYHHVDQGVEYPAVLFTLFDSDTRVDPMHGRKMCAALQWATGSDRPVLLRRETEVGHGARSVSRSADLAADTLAFQAEHLQLGGD